MSGLRELLEGRLYTPQQVEAITNGKTLKERFDAANTGKEMNPTLDKLVAVAAMADIRTKAAYAVQTWAETDDLDKGESLYDRLDALISSIADGGIDLDGNPATDDTDDVYMVAMQAASDYMSALGADDGDLETLFNSKDDEARDESANRLMEFLVDSMGDEDQAEDMLNAFAFDMDSESNVFDEAPKGTHKAVFAVRNNKKVTLRKRVGPKLKRTTNQKAALFNARIRAHTEEANKKRAKSLKLGYKLGLYK
jgi:hypothetical protein